MYNLFKEGYNPSGGVVMPPEWEYIKQEYLKEMLSVESYYHSRVYAVKGNHFLVRLLQTVTTPLEYPPDQYTRVTDTRASYIAKHFGLTSPTSKGVMHPGHFFGPGVNEFYLYNDDYFNPFEAAQDWRNICAVKTIMHPKTDLGLLLPNGKETSFGEGIAVISINVTLLALQYRSFCVDQYAKIGVTEGLLGINHFIHMYVLPNMIYSGSDITILNRLMALYYGSPISRPLLKHAFTLSDYSTKVDSVLNKVIKSLTGNSRYYVDALRCIPAFTDANIRDALILPDMAETVQVHWLIILSRLQVFKFLIDIGGDNGIRNNLTQIRGLQLILYRLDHNHTWSNTLPKDIAYDIQQLSKEIQSI